MTRYPLSRRTFLGGVAASPFVLSGLQDPARAADITVGIVYVGSRADYGWNQAHAVGARLAWSALWPQVLTPRFSAVSITTLGLSM